MYTVTDKDEVEDMLQLLAFAKQEHPEIEAVSSGAIASDYQRQRVEHVSVRLVFTKRIVGNVVQLMLLVQVAPLRSEFEVWTAGLRTAQFGLPVIHVAPATAAAVQRNA